MCIQTIIVAYNATDACRTALRHAAAVAAEAGATLHVVSVETRTVPVGGAAWVLPYEETLHQVRAHARVEEAVGLVADAAKTAQHALTGQPAVEIVRLAEQLEADLLVFGHVRHPALERVFLGTTGDRILRLSSVPCLMPISPEPPRRILVGADDSLYSELALQAALALGALSGARLRCVHAVPAIPEAPEKLPAESFLPSVREYFEAFVSSARTSVAPASPPGKPLPRVSTRVAVGEAGPVLVAEAHDWEADLVVVGSHGRGFVQRAILGSTSEYVLRHAPQSAMIVPGKA